MEQVYVREVNGEVLVILDKHVGSRINALREASKILAREVIREENKPAHLQRTDSI